MAFRNNSYRSANEIPPVAVITGSSSGIGYETAVLLARNGFDTYATVHNLNKSNKIRDIAKKNNLPLQTLELDVTSDKSIANAIEKIIREKRKIDIVINNAGYVSVGSVEDSSVDKIKDQFETNFLEVIRVMHAVVPIMRQQRSGTVVNISSVMGRIGFPLGAAYSSSKFALEGLSESMRYEERQFGINIILVEPGMTETNIYNNAKIVTNSKSGSHYVSLMQKMLTAFQSSFEKQSPAEVARIVLEAITSDNPEPRYLVGKDAVELMDIKKNTSDREFEKVMENQLN